MLFGDHKLKLALIINNLGPIRAHTPDPRPSPRPPSREGVVTFKESGPRKQAATKRPNGAASSQPRATPWVSYAPYKRALKGQKHIVIRCFCPYRAGIFTFCIPRALPWADCSLAFQAAQNRRVDSPPLSKCLVIPPPPSEGSEGTRRLTECQSTLSGRSRPLLRRADSGGWVFYSHPHRITISAFHFM